MEFTIEKKTLNNGLNQVSRLAAARMPLPILNNILIEADKGILILSVTDLELGIQTQLNAEVDTPGKFTVPAKLLHEFVQASTEIKFKGDVSDKATLTLKGNQSQAKIRGMDASEFPGLPFVDKPATFQVRSVEFKEAIDLVSYATAIDDTRPALAGISISVKENELVLAATDSHRLAEKKVKLLAPAEQACSVIVPKRTLLEMSRLLSDEAGDISVFVGDNQFQCSFGYTKMVSRLIEANYPPYQAIIPKEYQTRVTANLGDCIAALKMSQLFAREAGNMIVLTMVPGGGVTVESVAHQKGESVNQFTAITEGEELRMTFNVKYLLDALAVIKADNVFLEFNGVDKPLVVKPANSKEYISLVMPLRTD